MNVTDTHTDRQTPHDGIGRAYASIARQKLSKAKQSTSGKHDQHVHGAVTV